MPKGPHLPLVKGMLYCFLFNGVGPVGLVFQKKSKNCHSIYNQVSINVTCWE